MLQHVCFLKYFYTRKSLNHTAGDIFGIYLFSKVFEELAPIKKIEKKFYKKFQKQIFIQTRIDGTNIEQSINYHRFVLEFFTLFYVINSNKIKKNAKNLINKAFDYLLYTIKPDQSFPNIGDNDFGKALLLNYHEKNPFIYLLNLGSILFNRSDLKYVSKKFCIPTLLLLGIKSHEIYQNLEDKEPYSLFKYFNKAGYISLRNSWKNNANYLFIDNANFGPKGGPHSHSDITNIIFSYNGKNIFIDSGVYSYNLSWEDRNKDRCSKAHNILVINKLNQARIKSWFAWNDLPSVNKNLLIDKEGIKSSCIHNGYKDYYVYRQIKTDKNLDKIVIKDIIIPLNTNSNPKINDINIYFHFSKDVHLDLKDNKLKIDDNLSLEVFSSQEFNLSLEQGSYSPQYGVKYNNKLLNICSKHPIEKNKKIKVIIEITPLN